MKILIVRGAFANPFELQNILPLEEKHDITFVTSTNPIETISVSKKKPFFSPFDIIRKIPSEWQIIAKGFTFLLNRTLGDPHILFGLEEWIKLNGIWDIAHIAETYYGYDFQIARCKEKGYIKRVVSTCWETIPHNNESIWTKKRIKFYVKKYIDAYICPTSKAKQALIKEGIKENLINVIPMGVDIKRFSPLKKKRKNFFTLLFVGRLVFEKGILDLLKAFKIILKKRKNFKLIIVGRGPLKDEINKKLMLENISKYVECIYKPYMKIDQVYKSSDICIVPSLKTSTWEEQFGMVIVEAMACGVPVIAYNTGAIKEVLGDAGILVREGDYKSLTKAILHICSNESILGKLSKKARERAEVLYNSQKIAKKIENLYIKIN